ncbi:phosphotransferase enzyme family protein [Pseudomonas sp. L13]|uniref:phosphotransferase enzyme family protein n=1 Tax=Pseudomonas sp. L13 TaxID=343985 RepID=UPI00137AC124|nr:phosphotransferase [Pseudomonas sp. L13]NCE90232.1 hypothetical protein [Pseudomonas sp. L13]
MTIDKTADVQDSNPELIKEGQRVLGLIRQHYAIEALCIKRIYAGLGSRNWAIETAGESFFVKEFLSVEDTERGKISIEVTTHCIENGIISPAIKTNIDDEKVTELEEGGLAVFSFIRANEQVDKFSEDLMGAEGLNLADTHLALSSFPRPGEDETGEWLETSVAEIIETVEDLLGEIRQLEKRSEFDDISYDLLEDRKAQLQQYSVLIEPIKSLSKGVIHGDYGQKNIIVDEAGQLWVIDFGDAGVFFPSYELGRAAFPPENFDHDDWLARGLAMIKSYASRGFLQRNDLIFCARAWLVQLLQSVYGVKQHYLKPHELQHDLDLFWLRRGKATAALFKSLEEVEASIARIV